MKASDLFVRCLEAEGVTHIFGVPGEENADVMISLNRQLHPVRALPARAGRRLRRRRLRAADRQGGGVSRHPRTGGHQPGHRRRRCQHGPIPGGVHHRPGQHPAPAQGEPPEHGLGGHVRAHHQVGATPSGMPGRCRRWYARRSRPPRPRSPARPSSSFPRTSPRRKAARHRWPRSGPGVPAPITRWCARPSTSSPRRRRPDRARRQRRGPQARLTPAPALRPQDRHRRRQHLHGQGRGADVGSALPVHHGPPEPGLHQPRAR